MKDAMEEAERMFQSALLSAADLGSNYLVVSCLDGLAAAESKRDVDHASLVLGISDGLRSRVGVPRSSTERQIYEPYFASLREVSGAQSAERVRAAAEAMTLRQVVAAALTPSRPAFRAGGS